MAGVGEVISGFLGLSRGAFANLLLVVVVALVLVLPWRKARRATGSDPLLKGIGVLSVLVLALLASNDWVLFPLAIFVIATLITDAAFLQNLAAIFWNRSWWTNQGSRPQELRAKQAREAGEYLSSTKAGVDPTMGKNISQLAAASQQYEETVVGALDKASLTNPGSAQYGVTLRSRDGRQLVLDAVVARREHRYVIETKLLMQDPGRYEPALEHLRRLTEAYDESRGDKKRTFLTRGLLVLPRLDGARPFFDYDLGTALIQEDGTIDNLADLKAWFTTFDDVEIDY